MNLLSIWVRKLFDEDSFLPEPTTDDDFFSIYIGEED